MPEPGAREQPTGERVQKVLASLGFGSRRACEELIVEGRVRVNGERAHLGRRIELATDTVEVDGVPVGVRPDLVYYLLNKPVGVVTTATDPLGRSTVVELVPRRPRVFPVGRLDADSEGLLILTNDGELAQRLSHPSFGIDKEYLAHVEGTPSPGAIRRLRQGVELEDGLTAPAKVSSVAPGLLRVVIHEGRNRQVRRMCAAVGHPVLRLVRTRIGPVTDRRLAPGRWRPLSTAEVRKLATAQAGGGPRGGGAGPAPPRGAPRTGR
ncbi:MAG TPA: pseudouridine synthase [Acidimicrobiales bacterium]|nr:pseudouridine synthase [Acidimicrobiales bacterium]